MTIGGDLKVQGNISNITTLNNINPCKVNDYMQGFNLNTLYVDNAHFKQGSPMYKTLNHQNIRKTLEIVWLANENVDLPHHVEIADAYFEGLLNLKVSSIKP